MMSIGGNGTHKPNHFEETNPPEEDAAAIEVRLSSRASDNNDDIDVGGDTYSSSEFQASNARSKSHIFWMWRVLGISAMFVAFVSAITVVAKTQQQKRIAAAANGVDNDCIELSRMDVAPLEVVPVPATVDAVQSTCIATGVQCDGQNIPNNCNDCCTKKQTNCGESDKYCTDKSNDQDFICPTRAPTETPTDTPSVSSQPSTDCIPNGDQCYQNNQNKCLNSQGNPGNRICCSGAATNCGISPEKDWRCTDDDNDTDQCPSSSPSRSSSPSIFPTPNPTDSSKPSSSSAPSTSSKPSLSTSPSASSKPSTSSKPSSSSPPSISSAPSTSSKPSTSSMPSTSSEPSSSSPPSGSLVPSTSSKPSSSSSPSASSKPSSSSAPSTSSKPSSSSSPSVSSEPSSMPSKSNKKSKSKKSKSPKVKRSRSPKTKCSKSTRSSGKAGKGARLLRFLRGEELGAHHQG